VFISGLTRLDPSNIQKSNLPFFNLPFCDLDYTPRPRDVDIRECQRVNPNSETAPPLIGIVQECKKGQDQQTSCVLYVHVICGCWFEYGANDWPSSSDDVAMGCANVEHLPDPERRAPLPEN
jgi:hypothetical protein